jgi:hypothetical protein
MLTRGRCFKPMLLKFKLYKNELESLRAQFDNLKSKSSQPVSHAQPIQGLGSWEGPLRSFYGLSHNAMVGEFLFLMHTIIVSHQNLPLLFALLTSRHKKVVWHPNF